ncbi:stage III sporulation protein AD [Petroclostridium sp. X23]|jgi:stage III sporulation protein AD|uniref:stage III sporulation protein AD n=1 Tax=Petroclostridium sp. X23 TaxID=3045146 RepID=UPI0024AD6442|nr:stage III sporulation protein AD [Petroclostridium sp. X23]WHH59644.1 stage III sporulation protein AD [Petroclostridium sp. X23]
MEILQIVGLGMVAAVISIILKSQRPEISLQIGIITGVIIFALVVVNLSTVLKLLEGIANKVDLDLIYVTTIIKVIGIAYIAQFGAEVCRDAGEGAIASKIEFAGKILIIVMAAPIILALLNLLVEILP